MDFYLSANHHFRVKQFGKTWKKNYRNQLKPLSVTINEKKIILSTWALRGHVSTVFDSGIWLFSIWLYMTLKYKKYIARVLLYCNEVFIIIIAFLLHFVLISSFSNIKLSSICFCALTARNTCAASFKGEVALAHF